jgi:tetratricopeptide (TPR) repeat protein
LGVSDRLRIRGSHKQLSLTVCAVIIAAGAAAVAAWPHAWPWLIVATAALAAGASVGGPAIVSWQQGKAAAQRVARQELQGTTDAGDLPLVTDPGLEARVHRAVVALPYIRRDIEVQVRAHLEAGRPVLLVGSSMVGKTRMAATVIRDVFPIRKVVIPDSKDALASLNAADVVLRDTVIFLDDIQRLIGAGGITDGGLRRMAVQGNAIVGTIRAAEYDKYQPTDQLRPPEWDVLSVFEHVFVTRELTIAEQGRLTAAVSDPTIRERIRQAGLGEYVGAATYIAEALSLGPSVSPVGYSLVLGVADWRRAGMSTPAPALVLPALATPHLEARNRTDLSDKNAYAAALGWATRDINPTVSLLMQETPDTFAVSDYALDLITAQAEPIPAATWSVVIENANPIDLYNIGYAANATYHESRIADQAWRKAADSGHPVAAPLAARSLGNLLGNEGDVPGATKAFQMAINSGSSDAAVGAALDLGGLLMGHDDVSGAKQAFQTAIDSGTANGAAAGWFNLGILLELQSDRTGATKAFQKAIDSGHPDVVALGAIHLGTLLEQQGDLTEARKAFQKAIDSGHAEHAPEAARLLSALQDPGKGP